MPIDPSIALQVKPPVIADPMEVATRAANLNQMANANATAQLSLEQTRKDQADARKLSDLYSGNMNPDGTVNQQGLFSGAAAQGLGAKIPGLKKSFADSDKATADVGKTKSETSKLDFETAKGRMDASGAALNSLVADPNLTHDKVIRTITSLVQQGISTPEQGQIAVQNLPGDVEQLRQHLREEGLKVMDASKRMEMLTPKFQSVDVGNGTQMGTVDPMTGKYVASQTVGKSVSPDAQLSASTSRSNASMTDKRERDLANQGVTYQPDANGNLVALPTKVTPGAPVVGKAAVGPDGQPMQSPKGDLNDSQAKALGFGSRMHASAGILDTLAAGRMDANGNPIPGTGVDQPGKTKRVLESIPVVGGSLGTLANGTQSASQQQVEQAQRDFVNAVLRRESGAAISPSEFDNANKQYFVQPNDDPETINQKKANRDLAINGVMAEVPRAQRKFLTSDAPSSAPAPTVQTTAGPKPGAMEMHGGKLYRFKGGDASSSANWEVQK